MTQLELLDAILVALGVVVDSQHLLSFEGDGFRGRVHRCLVGLVGLGLLLSLLFVRSVAVLVGDWFDCFDLSLDPDEDFAAVRMAIAVYVLGSADANLLKVRDAIEVEVCDGRIIVIDQRIVRRRSSGVSEHGELPDLVVSPEGFDHVGLIRLDVSKGRISVMAQWG